MDQPPVRPNPTQLLMMLRIQWFSFIVASCVIGGVSVTMGAQTLSERHVITWPLAGLAVALGGMSLWGARRMARVAIQLYIFRWAFAEAVAILGLVLSQLGEPRSVFLPFAAAALALIVLASPSEDEIRAFPPVTPGGGPGGV